MTISGLHGPTVILTVLAIAGAIVFAFIAWEKDHEDRQRRRDLDGVDEWERTKSELPPRFPRSLP